MSALLNMQCQCLTKAGKRCTRKPNPNSLFCWQHQNCPSALIQPLVKVKSKSPAKPKSNPKPPLAHRQPISKSPKGKGEAVPSPVKSKSLVKGSPVRIPKTPSSKGKNIRANSKSPVKSPVLQKPVVKPIFFTHRLEKYGKRITALSKGSYGTVYKYFDEQTNQTYAVKSFTNGLEQTTTRELSILSYLAQFRHPNIVPIIDMIKEGDDFYMVMPFAEYGDLASYVKATQINFNTPNGAKQIKKIIYQIISGNNVMHQRNIMNRDIKPQNVLVFKCDPSNTNVKPTVDEDIKVVIADFGLARSNVCTVTGFTNQVFTLWYRAPEIPLGCPYTEAADVWAIGCIFMQLLEGKPLFPADSDIDLIFKIMQLCGRDAFIEYVNSMGGRCKEGVIVEKAPKFKGDFENKISIYEPLLQGILRGMLQVDPSKRINLADVLINPYFDDIRDEINGAVCIKGRQEVIEDITCLNRIKNSLSQIDSFVDKQPEITEGIWRIVIDWLSDVRANYNTSPQTMFGAFNIIAKVLSSQFTVEKRQMQLIGVSAFLLSSYIREVYPPTPGDMIYISDHTYTLKELEDMNTIIFRLLPDKIIGTTAYDLIMEYGKLHGYSPSVLAIAEYYLYVLYFSEYRYTLSQSELALVASYYSVKRMPGLFQAFIDTYGDFSHIKVRTGTMANFNNLRNLSNYPSITNIRPRVDAKSLLADAGWV